MTLQEVKTNIITSINAIVIAQLVDQLAAVSIENQNLKDAKIAIELELAKRPPAAKPPEK